MAHVSNHTRLVLFQDIIRILAALHPATRGLIQPSPTTSNGTTATVVDTKLGRGSRDANFYDGCTVYITSGTRIGDIATVNDGGFDGSSTLTVSPTMGGTTTSGDTYALLPPGLAPEIVQDEINRVLRETYAPHLYIPTLVGDGDFEADAVGTDWPDINTSNTVKAFVTTAAFVLFGDRSLHITADAGGDGARSLSIPVTDVETVLLSVWIKVVAGTMDVVLRDVTGSADLGTEVIANEEAWTEVRLTQAMAAAQHNLQVYFRTNANLDECYISAFVTVQAQNPRPYNMPDWFVSRDQFMHALELPAGLASEVSNTNIALSGAIQSTDIKPEFIRSHSAVHPFMVQLPGVESNLIALMCKRAFSEITSDTATTHADRTYVTKKAVANIHSGRGAPDIGGHGSQAARLADGLEYGREPFSMEQGPQVVRR